MPLACVRRTDAMHALVVDFSTVMACRGPATGRRRLVPVPHSKVQRQAHQRSPRPAECSDLRITPPEPATHESAELTSAAVSEDRPPKLAEAPSPPKGDGDAAVPNKLVAAGAPNIPVPAPPKSGAPEPAVAPNVGAVAGPLVPKLKVGVAVLELAAPKAKPAAGRSAGARPKRGADCVGHSEPKTNCDARSRGVCVG
jgi:hypothetical protein